MGKVMTMRQIGDLKTSCSVLALLHKPIDIKKVVGRAVVSGTDADGLYISEILEIYNDGTVQQGTKQFATCFVLPIV